MSIIEKIHSLRQSFIEKHGYEPKNIYLGSEEYYDLEDYAKEMREMGNVKEIIDFFNSSVMGMTIYRVFKESHLNVAL
jgi:hypothetical protein